MAGSWTNVTPTEGVLNGHLVPQQCLEAEFTADATDASVPVLQVGASDSAGLLHRFSVKFDGTTPPTGASFTVKITDRNGVAIGNPDGTAITETSNVTCNQLFVGNLYVNVTGNETNSAKATVSLYVRS